jgi:hypothetical protein
MSRQKKKKLLERLKRVPKPKADTPLTERNIPRLGYVEDFKRTLHQSVYLSEICIVRHLVTRVPERVDRKCIKDELRYQI